MKKEVITFKEAKSPISEIFRTLRTNLQFMNTKNGLRSMLITSTSPGDGKSWTSANLAVTFAQAGKRVVIVDADMRKGKQFSIFGVPPTPGLSNFLSGIDSEGRDSSPDITQYARPTEVENLYLIPAGNVPPNPSELLVSQKMIDGFESLKRAFDLVIFDGTPTDLVTDSIIISRYVDCTLIVASYKGTKTDSLQKLKRNIENVGGKIAGVVLNKMPMDQKEYYSSYYYGSSDRKKLPRKKSSSESSKFREESNDEQFRVVNNDSIIQQVNDLMNEQSNK